MSEAGMEGIAYLVGAGPGSAGLITVLGRRRLRRADCVLYDLLIDPALLSEARPEAELICVGKRAGRAAMSQEEINRVLCEKTARGRVVVRLKGGDPYIFGRGGEEAMALAGAGLRFEIVPGVTSASAAAAFAGVPLTHRGLASAVTLVTGHERPGKEKSDVDWHALARGGQTLCVYMGTENIAGLAQRLLAGGRSPGEPAVVVENAAAPNQRTISLTLEKMAALEPGSIAAPALAVIGPTVTLRESLAWLERKPLFGKTMLLTRTRNQASVLARILADAGAEVLELPLIAIDDIPFETEDGKPDPSSRHLLDLAESAPKRNEWVVFTSVNGVASTLARMRRLGLDARIFGGRKIAAVGPGTAGELERHGLLADLVPGRHEAKALCAALLDRFGGDVSGGTFHFFVGNLAPDDLWRELGGEGAECRVSRVYVNRPVEKLDPAVVSRLEEGAVAAVLFASASAARNFAGRFGERLGDWLARPSRPRFVSIGPTTSSAMREGGLPVDAEADNPGVEELARVARIAVASIRGGHGPTNS